MAATAIENPAPVRSDSKSARKKKVKGDASVSSSALPTVPVEVAKDDSIAAEELDSSSEHPYLRELQKQIRNVNKKLSGTQKTDALISQNPGISLDELVAQRKINLDQKASALKKPQLQAQLVQLEEQVEHYRKFDAEYQQKLSKQKEELTTAHQKELEKLTTEQQTKATTTDPTDLRQKLLTFSQFLRAAAHRRSLEAEADAEINRAFEGILLLVYGGDEKAVDAAVNLLEGSEENVPSVDGEILSFSYARVKQASIEHAPYQVEEAWVDQVAEATGDEAIPAGSSDPTIANAGLTELNGSAAVNGAFSGYQAAAETEAPVNSIGDATGNVASERWDTGAAGTAAGPEDGELGGSYTIIPRPNDEVDIKAPSSADAPQSSSWADESQAQEIASAGNAVAEKWDTRVAGEQGDSGWNTPPAANNGADDGFHEVAGRHRGRGRGRGEGEFRGRGGRRGNFRGGRGAPRGDFRGGRGGRGGPRGGAGNGAPAPAPAS